MVAATMTAAGLAADSEARAVRAGLEGDGVSHQLFELLWKRDTFSDSALALRIPDTVIFKYSAPLVWYFTSVDGTIKRKTKAKVNREHIAEEFLRRASPSGIVAYYVSSECDTGVTAHNPDLDADEQDISEASTRTTIEYFNCEELQDFLDNRSQARPSGILQRFVEPNGDHNNMIRVLWSPKVCLLERRVNRLKLSDTRYDKYERAVTFEGPDFHSQVKPVRGPALVMQVHEIAEDIVQHVGAVTGDRMKISRMALNFKFDDRERLWLLFPSSIRIREDLKRGPPGKQGTGAAPCQTLSTSPLEANAVLQVPEHVRRIGTTVLSRPAALQRTRCCPICHEKVDPNGLWDASYKVLIEYDEKRHGEPRNLPIPTWPPASKDVNTRQEVPEPLQQLHPRLTEEEYAQLRHDAAFLYKVATVCEACYLKFSGPQLGDQWRSALEALGGYEDGSFIDFTSAEATKLRGTQALDPERIRKRYRATKRRMEREASEQDQVEELIDHVQLKAQHRSRSCPKLPSWGPGLDGRVQWPPAPVLSEARPRPPGGLPPAHSAATSAARASSNGPDHLRLSPQRRRRVPPLRGESYLRELQEFAERCPKRAEAVLHCQLPSGAHRGTQKRSRAAGAARAAPARTEAVATEQVQPQQMGATDGDVHDLDTGADESGEKLDLGDIYEDDVPLDSSDGIDADPIMAQLWSKWPPSCGAGFSGRGESRTPTTRPPSSGEASQSRPSSYPSSRPSSRPASRLLSARSATRSSQVQSRSSMRPWSSPNSVARPPSSPLAGHGSLGASPSHGKPRPASSPQLARSASSPQLTFQNQQSKSLSTSNSEVSSPHRRTPQSASSSSPVPAGPRGSMLREATLRSSSTPKAASQPVSPVVHPHSWK